MTGRTFALLAGGGTGGHTYPAVALAQELVARGHTPDSIRFVGGRRGPEGGIVQDAGFAIDLLPGRGLQRRLTLANVGVVLATLAAFARAVVLVRRYRPRVVVGFGGYASLPCVVGAWVWRVPRLVHEQDAVMGLANRIGVRLGARAAASLPGITGAVLTGNPVRAEFRPDARPPHEPPLVVVYGGTLGAASVNRAALALYDRWRDRTDVAMHLVTGPRNHAEVSAAMAGLRRPGDALRCTVVGYESQLAAVLHSCAVAVCRAGAGTVAELATVGVPAVLIPLPGAPGDHQSRNAATLAGAGAAVVLVDHECDGEHLEAALTPLLTDPERRAAMAAAARGLARPDAARRLADLVEEQARDD